MNANTLRNLFSEYNAHKEEIYDKRVDSFIGQVRQELAEIYEQGTWITFAECTQLGISLYNMNRSFKKFQYSFGWVLVRETLKEDYEKPTFEEFFSNVDWDKDHYECCGFQDKEIIHLLKPFVEALQRKGFDVYFDEGNECLIVAFNITENQK